MSSLQRIGRYELIEVLGRSGASTVYRARDPAMDRDVALKTLELTKVGPQRAGYRKRFEREARAAGQLDHPGIVTVYDVGEDPGQARLFLAMEYLGGGTLADLVEAGVRFEPSHAAELGARLAEALHVAHEAGIVHRDVKPGNILIGLDGAVKLADFGIARLGVSDLTRSGETMGTPYYMAPEQITSRPVDGRTDLYAVGVILYELLAGRRPFQAEAIGELVHRIATEAPLPLSSLRPELPEALVATVHRCLAKSPDKRHASGRALAATLREACPPPPVGSEPPWMNATALRRPPAICDSAESTLPVNPVHTREVDGSPTTRLASSHTPDPSTIRWPRVAVLSAGVVLAALVVLGVAMRARGPAPPVDPDPGGRTARLRAAAVTLQAAEDRLTAGDPEGALAAATAVLAVTPDSPAAQQVVARATAELERRRIAALEQRPEEPVQVRRAAPVAAPVAASPAPARPTPTSAAVPAAPLLSVIFDSPLAQGSLVAEGDGGRIGELTWDFTERGFLGLRTGDGGPVRGELQLPTGDYRLRIELHAGRRGQIGAHEFAHRFATGEHWRLTVRMENSRSTPAFELERAPRSDD